MNNKYQPVIGLEVHVELKTKSKMFCGCSADYFGKQPNTHTCPVCLGLPGALPVPNKKAIEWCVMIGMALNCEIPLFSKFDRKNYFYPDLAKGYQISQYDQPFAINGKIEISNKKKEIRIRRVHMEEDTAKLTHQFRTQNSKIKNQNDEGYSLIDFNRSGVPLVEIVTEPDFYNAEDVVDYLKKLQQIVRYLDVSNADMEKGDMRLEPNISLRLAEQTDLPKYKVEVKNINSFRFVEKAINYEIKRQTEILDNGEIPAQETRGFNETKNNTLTQRSKEEANDYRYFPEPDIPPIRWEKSQISNIKSHMPELPDKKFARFVSEFKLTEYDSEILTRERSTSEYFEECVKVIQNLGFKIQEKIIANYIINRKVNINNVLPAELIKTIMQNSQVSTIDLNKFEQIIEEVLKENEKAVLDYKNGKENAIMFLVGQVMRKSEEKLDANLVKQKIVEKIKEVR